MDIHLCTNIIGTDKKEMQDISPHRDTLGSYTVLIHICVNHIDKIISNIVKYRYMHSIL